jgi:hypothetical protein
MEGEQGDDHRRKRRETASGRATASCPLSNEMRFLHRESHETFEDYCRKRWGFTKARANQLIGAAEIAGDMATTVAIPPRNERQARELARIPAEQRAGVWERAVSERGTEVTAADIRRVVVPTTPRNEAQARGLARI